MDTFSGETTLGLASLLKKEKVKKKQSSTPWEQIISSERRPFLEEVWYTGKRTGSYKFILPFSNMAETVSGSELHKESAFR